VVSWAADLPYVPRTLVVGASQGRLQKLGQPDTSGIPATVVEGWLVEGADQDRRGLVPVVASR
jgi:hypothetical protein